jgi:hypothetical protein
MLAKKKTAKKITKLVLYTGYVESGSTACVLMKHVKGFNTVKEALTHIGQAMKSVAEYHMRYQPGRTNKCCAEHAGAKFCSECGNPLAATEAGASDIEHEFMNFFHGTYDDMHDHYEFLDAGGWSYYHPEGFFDPNVVWIAERAEELIAALGAGDEEAFKFSSQFMHDVKFD